MKKFISLLLLVFICISHLAIPAYADSEKRSGLFTYELKGNGNAVITGFDWNTNGSEDIYIPRQIDGYNVSEIGPFAFSSNDAGVHHDRLSEWTEFDYNTIGEKVVVILPDTITIIGEKAFFCTNITACNIPSSVQLIGPGAFAGCINLSQHSVDIKNANYATINGVLYNKIAKELVAFPNSMAGQDFSIPEGIKSIGDYAFYGMELRNVIFSDTVVSIGDYSFNNCYYYSDTFDLNNVKSIGDYAFAGSTLNGRKIKMNCIESIGNYAFYSTNTRAYTLTLPPQCKQLGIGCFMYFCDDEERPHYGYMNSRFETIDLSKTSLNEIPDYAFSSCTFVSQNNKQRRVLLPKGLKKIGEHAFEWIGTMELGSLYYSTVEVIIPDELTEICESAFENAGIKLTFAENGNLKTIADKAFYQCYIRGSDEKEDILVLPDGLETIGSNAFNCYNISTLSIPSSVKSIGDTVADRSLTKLEVVPNSYGALYASENGFSVISSSGEDTSWLNG